MELVRIKLITTYYTNISNKRPLLLAYTSFIIKKFLFAINLLLVIIISYDKKLLNLKSIYIDNIKYGNYNDSFIF